MPTFQYTARDASGNPVNGTVAAPSMDEATQQLRREGKYPTSIMPVGQATENATDTGAGGIAIPRADLIHLSNQLAIMVDTGVTLTEALDCIAQQTEKPKVKALIEDVVHSVHAGTDLSTALSRHQRSFPRLYVALIRASEKSGMMGKLLVRATAYLRDEHETLRRVKGALVYPAVMFGFATLTTIFLLAFVLPKFTAIYANKAAALPMPTKILMSMSNFLVAHYIALPIAVAVLVIGGYIYTRTQQGRRVLHWLQLNTPWIGKLFRKLHLARSLRMIGTMAGAGVPLTDAVTTAQDLCDNVYFRELWSNVLQKIQVGHQLWEPLRDSPLVPASITQMISSGEKSGKLAGVMDQISGFAEQELKEQIADMTRYIEPIMIVVMGIIIGGVTLALLLPIFTISRVVAQ